MGAQTQNWECQFDEQIVAVKNNVQDEDIDNNPHPVL